MVDQHAGARRPAAAASAARRAVQVAGLDGSAALARPGEFGHRAGYAVAAIPIAFALLLEVLSHEFLAPLGDDRVSLLGLPAGAFFVAAVLLLALLGGLAVRYVRSPVIVGAVLIFTTSIGLMLVIMGPAVVLIMINLHT